MSFCMTHCFATLETIVPSNEEANEVIMQFKTAMEETVADLNLSLVDEDPEEDVTEEEEGTAINVAYSIEVPGTYVYKKSRDWLEPDQFDIEFEYTQRQIENTFNNYYKGEDDIYFNMSDDYDIDIAA